MDNEYVLELLVRERIAGLRADSARLGRIAERVRSAAGRAKMTSMHEPSVKRRTIHGRKSEAHP